MPDLCWITPTLSQIPVRQVTLRNEKARLLSPSPKWLAVSLFKCVTLKLQNAFALVVSLDPPRAKHGRRSDFLEMADEPNVVLKMTIQDRPQKGAQPFHGDKIHLRRWTRSVLDSQPLVPFPMSWVAMGFKAGRSCRRGPRLAQPQGHLAAGQDKSC